MKNPLQSNRRKFRALETRMMFIESALETFFSSPLYTHSDDIGFNGQKIRKMIFNELVNLFSFDAIIETGTYTGNTTGYMAKQTSLPIYSCESNRVLHALSKRRLSEFNNITCYSLDSRDFLKTLSNEDVRGKRVFIYLDAHCNDDLPLKQELEIINRTWDDFVVMIDDFEVPGDSGYGFDSYVENQILSTKVFLPIFASNSMIAYFPTRPSSEETGAKRGSVILTKDGVNSEKISKCALLKRYQG